MAKKLSSKEQKVRKQAQLVKAKPVARVVAKSNSLSSLKSAAGASAGYTGIKTGNSMTPQQIAYQRGLDKQYNASPQSKIDSSIYAAKGIRADSGGGNTNRSKAQSVKPKSTGISTGALKNAFESGGLTLNKPATPTLTGPTSIGQGSSGIFQTIRDKARGALYDMTSGMGDMARQDSRSAVGGVNNTQEQRDNNIFAARNQTLGIPTTNASNVPDLPLSTGDNGEIFYTEEAANRPSIFTSDFATPGTNFNRPGSEDAYNQGKSPVDYGRQVRDTLGIGTANAQDSNPYEGAQSRGGNQGYNQGDNQDNGNQSYDNGAYSVPGQSSSLADIAAALGTNPADTPMEDNPGGTVKNRSGRGSGAFGTGKGIQSDDPYIKELRKAYSSNGGEKWLRKQFDELIAALDPTYAQMQKEGTDALNSQLNEQNTKLASVMNAGNVGDSEQRAQLMAGQQRDTQTALGNLLAKLAQNKAGDVSQYKTQYAQQRGQLADRNQSNQQKLMEQIQQYRNQQATGSGRGSIAPTMSNPKLSRNDVFNWTEDALNKGYSWQEIADNAKEQGIGTETGGYLDQLLNQANKQNRYR